MYTKEFKSYLENINKNYNSNKPLFSVIIPLYNKENYIKRAINSVLKQTFQNFEIIIVDDCSTDKSLSVVKSIKDKRVNIFSRKQNKGPHFARNFGIRRARGKYIAFLDADDKYKSFFLMTVVNLIFKYPDIKIYATSFEKIYSFMPTIKTSYGKSKDCIVNNFIEKIVENKSFSLHLSSTIIEKKLLIYAGLFCSHKQYEQIDISGEDIDLFIRLSMYYNKVAYSNRICSVYYRTTENSISRTVSNKQCRFGFVEKSFAIKKRMAKTKEEKEVLDKYKYLFYESVVLQLIMKKNFDFAEKVLKRIPINYRKQSLIKILKIQKASYYLQNGKI